MNQADYHQNITKGYATNADFVSKLQAAVKAFDQRLQEFVHTPGTLTHEDQPTLETLAGASSALVTQAMSYTPPTIPGPWQLAPGDPGYVAPVLGQPGFVPVANTVTIGQAPVPAPAPIKAAPTAAAAAK